ncbi:uncharacterized protein LOC113501663 [Trichoplusia ni]|uniref:Uncharacterized protein LOC113501663 n=1 Tax=Trichoplusia ni TaxID=7111 RepID=A0A7E5WER0_TRINI|nr:uncharacterized protein LOC113501663 [Trichoplusia ni]
MFAKDIYTEESMAEAVEGGAALAWRVLATLEGGSLLLASSALLVYSVRNKITKKTRTWKDIRRVLVTNTTNLLGRAIKTKLEERGCIVEVHNEASRERGAIVDAIVIVGAEPKTDGLDGMATLVTEDVYDNLKLLESLSRRVRGGGRLAWACAGAAPRPYSCAGAAFDTVLRASLQHVAKMSQCEPIWVGRCGGAEAAAGRVVEALLARPHAPHATSYTVRNAVHRVGECLCRWFKIIT